MSVLVLGAGGVGGYLGASMITAGIDTTFVVRPHRVARLRDAGINVVSPLGDWHVYPAVFGSDEISETYEVVIIACKAYDLASALDAIEPAVGRGTAIIPFLNGVHHLSMIQRRYPNAAHWGGVAHIGVTTDAVGQVRHLNDLNRFVLGPIDGDTQLERVTAIVERLRNSPADAEIRATIQQDMWDKLVFLATLAGITCLMRNDIGSILAAPHGKELILELLSECRMIAEAEGHATQSDAIESYRAQLTQQGSKSTSSMLRDLNSGRRTEADHILGDLIGRAKQHGLSTPLLHICLTHLQTYEISKETGS